MTPDELRARREALAASAQALQRMPLRARALAIGECARQLREAEWAAGRELRAELLRTTGLSLPNLELGLSTTLGLFEPEALIELVRRHGGRPARGPCVLVLAGNVWSAAARPLLLPLLCGVPVLAKAASRDDAFPRVLARTLREVEPELGAACEVVTFDHHDHALLHALLDGTTLVSAYGDDDTIAAIGARLPKGATLLAHGHGLGVVCLGAEALSAASARSLSDSIARDVAAYDQRGCLSPHAVLVEAGGEVGARDVAGLLVDALAAVNLALPLGAAPPAELAGALQWRGVAAATGTLLAHESGAVALLARDEPLRPSPGRRHVAVREHGDLDELHARLRSFGPHLKALGVAGERTRAALASLAPYVCVPGQMQSPPLETALDGLHPLAGYLD